MEELRGFAGINYIFFNTTHFNAKLKSFKREKVSKQITDKLEKILCMDIGASAIHEGGHSTLRHIKRNLNFSTPTAYQGTDVLKHEFGFGKMAEVAIFGHHISWFRSIQTCNMVYVDAFIAAIENGTSLPNHEDIRGVIYRRPTFINGMDYEIGENYED